MTEKIAKALAVLEAEGLAVVLRPDAVVVKVGSLEITQPETALATVRVALDGVAIQNRLAAIELRLKAGTATEAELHLGVLP